MQIYADYETASLEVFPDEQRVLPFGSFYLITGVPCCIAC